VIGPWTGEPVGIAADASAADVEAAIAAARRAFDDTDWSTNIEKRVALVTKLRALFEENRERLSDLARHEAGAALGAVSRAHVDMALNGWDDYLAVFPQVTWEKDFRRPHRLWFREPSQGGPRAGRRRRRDSRRGTCRSTSMSARSSRALLAGCTLILKPAPNTPGMGASSASWRLRPDSRRASSTSSRQRSGAGGAKCSSRIRASISSPSPARPGSASGSWSRGHRR